MGNIFEGCPNHLNTRLQEFVSSDLAKDGNTDIAHKIADILDAKRNAKAGITSQLAKRIITPKDNVNNIPVPPVSAPPIPLQQIAGGIGVIAMTTVLNKQAIKSPKMDITPNFSWLDIDPVELAKQLTLIDYQLFSQIQATELLNQYWTKAKYNHQKSPNILKCIENFNFVANIVSAAIVNEEKVRQRAKIMAYFIKVAMNLRKLNNFIGLMAFNVAFNASSVSRLKWTKEALPSVSQHNLDEIGSILNMESAFKHYRETLEESTYPCIPCLSVHLQDLIFIEEGNPDMVDGLLNFSKRRLVYSVIQKVEGFQSTQYDIAINEELVQYISSFKKYNENNEIITVTEKDLYQISLSREPRGAKKEEIL